MENGLWRGEIVRNQLEIIAWNSADKKVKTQTRVLGNGTRKKTVSVKDYLKVSQVHRVFNRVHRVVLGIYSAF